jgi:hypothetical protein
MYYRIDRAFESINCFVIVIWLCVSILAWINPLSLYEISIPTIITIIGCFCSYFFGYLLMGSVKSSNKYNTNTSFFNYGYFSLSLILSLFLILNVRFWSVLLDLSSIFGIFGIFNAGDLIYDSRHTQLSIGIPVLIPIEYLSMVIAIFWFNTKANISRIDWFIYAIMTILPLLLSLMLQSRLNIVILLAIYLHGNYIFGRKVINIRLVLLFLLGIFVVSFSRDIQMNSRLIGSSTSAMILAGIAYYASVGIFAFDQFMQIPDATDFNNVYILNGLKRLLELIFNDNFGSVFETKLFYTPLRTITATSLMMIWSDVKFVSFGLFLVIGAIFNLLSKIQNTYPLVFVVTFALVINFSISFFALMSFNRGFWIFIFVGALCFLVLTADRQKIGEN